MIREGLLHIHSPQITWGSFCFDKGRIVAHTLTFSDNMGVVMTLIREELLHIH